MAAMLVSSVVGLGFATLAARRVQPRAVALVLPAYAAPIWRRTAVPLVILGATELLMNRTGVLLLGWLGDTANAGIYSLIFNIAFVATLPRAAVNTLFAPTISGLFAQKDMATLQVLVARAASWTLIGAICISAVLAFIAEPLVTWFGRDFEAGVPALRILLLGQVIVSSAGSQLHLMTMTGHERSAAVLLFVIAAGNAVGSAALISLIGLIGAATAATIAVIGWNLAMSYFLWHRLHLLPGVLALFRLAPTDLQV
jgi:O-antigen/teichoic acid export membrane protein